MNILLDYFFPINVIEPTPAASTAFLKNICVVVSPKVGVTDKEIVLCTTSAEIAALTDNDEVTQLLDAGMSRVYVLPASDLDIASALAGAANDFYTVAISSDFDKTAIDAADFGTFDGVIGVSETDDTWLKAEAAKSKRAAFHTTATNGAKNMLYAFGKLLSNQLNWLNQQFIEMPLADDVDTLGEANTLFDDKISFVLNDSEFGKRLGLFAVGGKAIIAPYVTRNLELDIQSAALSYISGNQPQYTLTEATLLEDTLQQVIDGYIERRQIEDGVIEIKLEKENFEASGYINIAEPNALWRVLGQMKQTL